MSHDAASAAAPPRAAVRCAGSRSGSRPWSPTTASTSRRPRARCTRCSARTAPARARSRTSSPGSTGPTRARSSSYGEPVEFHSPRDALDAGIGMVHQHFRLVAAVHGRRERDPRRPPRRGADVRSSPARIERRVAELGERYRHRGRPAGAHLAAVARRAAAGRDPEGALPRGADPDPRRADRGADAAGGRVALRDAAGDGRRGPDGDLHLAQAARGHGRLRPGDRAPRRPDGRHRRRRRARRRARSRR